MATFTEISAAACFALAIGHTFSIRLIQRMARRFPDGSVGENLFHLLGEVEIVFGAWAAIFLFIMGLRNGSSEAIRYIENCNFTEPAFVFVIMAVCATNPILKAATAMLELCSKALPFKTSISFYIAIMVLGPLLGSFITEPAAMTVCALLLLDRYVKEGTSNRFKYATLGLLFVNVSIGGTLTPYAAPPVLMVASKWNWGLFFMLSNFGWKALVAICISTAFIAFRFRNELATIPPSSPSQTKQVPFWTTLAYLAFLALIVISSHHLIVFAGIFLFFLGLVSVTREYQHTIKLREGLLVAFFLGGLVVLGGMQRWWLAPILSQLGPLPLFLGSIGLTAITDNAALTYLGAQVPNLGELARYSLVAGSIAGGGLTVIANAPNPAGYAILTPAFGKDGISPLSLFRSAFFPTVIATACFWLL